ncbi:T9SS type A sorting domain-containing protein [Sabulilitoribacter multivorans]|uniref:T9SS type A sorting domain-containing protein n=1 Tax=Flaviramulus multivorans TaxID=1304750 RepID=A0ABS9ILG3_9FLAO|nr:T9SS type A sorting domain-containing protein [Flaviramulus multivorans]MCF7561452.1 T9SS type A sorting domain-containing protein [Flaviramulus multivorans]
MKKLNFILVALFTCFVVKAQITSAEYFIDTDPGVGNGTPLNLSGNSIDQNFNIPTSGLADGVHKLYVRLINTDNSWSLYDKQVFFVNPDKSNLANIASAEYFMDTDPGVGNASPLTVSGNIIDQNLSIPTTGISNGIHKLYVRVINDDDSWSIYDKNVFYVSPSNSNSANIASAEYFIDTDPGVGNANPLTVSGNIIDQDLNIPTTGISNGIHKLYVRVINDDNSWSIYDKNVFFINPNNTNNASIASAEYFIDTDPGVGNGTPLVVSGNIVDADFNIATTGLSEGIHKLYVRLFNDENTWSLYDKYVFYVSPNNLNTALITAAEYFFDIDPGIGNATSIDLDDAEIIDEDLVFQVPANLPAGDHFLYVRIQNTDGNWSLYALGENITLGTNDLDLKYFKYYPNPVKDILYLNTNNQTILDFKVIDLNGRVILNEIPDNFTINLNRLNSGTYLFQLKTDTGHISKKFVKE